ncbi:hypothetical protein MMC31_007967 [Peltigera leucophlebia]|nr:hypothetical protein [Peltigera leucophlebia]
MGQPVSQDLTRRSPPMELSPFAEQTLAGVLNLYSPSSVFEAEKLLPSFREFFARGTRQDCLKFLVWTLFTDTASLPTDPSLPTPLTTASSTALPIAPLNAIPLDVPPLPTLLPTSAMSTGVFGPSAPGLLTNASITAFYCNKTGSKARRVKRLVSVTEGIINAQALHFRSYQGLWFLKEGSFEVFETVGGSSSPTDVERRNCVLRVSLLLMVYRTDCQEAVLNQGKTRTTALNMVAEHFSLEQKVVRDYVQKGRRYMLLLLGGGPGSLLEMGMEASQFECSFTNDDIKLFLEYRKSKLPAVERRVQILNPIASMVILDGLIANSWKYSDLATHDGELMAELKKYVNLDQLAHKEKRGLCGSQWAWKMIISNAESDILATGSGIPQSQRKRRRSVEEDQRDKKLAR